MKKSTVTIIWEYLTGYKNQRQQLKQQIEQLEREKGELIKTYKEQQESYWNLHVSKNVLVANHANEVRDLRIQIRDLKTTNQLLRARLTVTSS